MKTKSTTKGAIERWEAVVGTLLDALAQSVGYCPADCLFGASMIALTLLYHAARNMTKIRRRPNNFRDVRKTEESCEYQVDTEVVNTNLPDGSTRREERRRITFKHSRHTETCNEKKTNDD